MVDYVALVVAVTALVGVVFKPVAAALTHVFVVSEDR